MGGAKEARHSCRASKAIPITQFAKMMGFAKGSTHPTGFIAQEEQQAMS
jgi:hypothetical protein